MAVKTALLSGSWILLALPFLATVYGGGPYGGSGVYSAQTPQSTSVTQSTGGTTSSPSSPSNSSGGTMTPHSGTSGPVSGSLGMRYAAPTTHAAPSSYAWLWIAIVCVVIGFVGLIVMLVRRNRRHMTGTPSRTPPTDQTVYHPDNWQGPNGPASG